MPIQPSREPQFVFSIDSTGIANTPADEWLLGLVICTVPTAVRTVRTIRALVSRICSLATIVSAVARDPIEDNHTSDRGNSSVSHPTTTTRSAAATERSQLSHSRQSTEIRARLVSSVRDEGEHYAEQRQKQRSESVQDLRRQTEKSTDARHRSLVRRWQYKYGLRSTAG